MSENEVAGLERQDLLVVISNSTFNGVSGTIADCFGQNVWNSGQPTHRFWRRDKTIIRVHSHDVGRHSIRPRCEVSSVKSERQASNDDGLITVSPGACGLQRSDTLHNSEATLETTRTTHRVARRGFVYGPLEALSSRDRQPVLREIRVTSSPDSESLSREIEIDPRGRANHC